MDDRTELELLNTIYKGIVADDIPESMRGLVEAAVKRKTKDVVDQIRERFDIKLK